jgi:DNA-binding response OmpR family regulator
MTYIFRREGFDVIAAFDGSQGWERFQKEGPELVVLDANMPGMDGMEVCRRIREHSSTPVIMLTARTDESDVVNALGLGADDYITKPFSPKNLMARARAVLRRAQAFSGASTSTGEIVNAGDLVLDLRTRTLTRSGEEIRLTPLEFKILNYLMVNRGRVLTNAGIVEHVWGFSGAGNEDLVKVHIHRLRQKLERDPQNPEYVRTVPGVGYLVKE